jgi:hypothetical protein
MEDMPGLAHGVDIQVHGTGTIAEFAMDTAVFIRFQVQTGDMKQIP